MSSFPTTTILLVLGLLNPVLVSPLEIPEDLEASGNDLEISGSGDDPQPEDVPKIDPRKITATNGNKIKTSSDLNHRPKKPSTSEFIVVENSKSFLEYKETVAAISAGGTTGAVFGATLSAILIYRWKKKQKEEGCSKKKASDEDY